MKISDIDKNLRVAESVDIPDVRWMDADSGEFRLYGAYSANPYRRLPKEIADAANEGVAWLAGDTAGIRLRLRTDSRYIAIHAEWGGQCCFSHMPVAGVCGFDLYRLNNGWEYCGTYMPPFNSPHGYESIIYLNGEMNDFVLNFPLYNHVDKLYIGVSENAKFETPAEYGHRIPFVTYGSSITQGGCASRPGNSYQNMLTRRFDVDHINLGFSGSARGEQIVADYIAGLETSVFVLDYDHNAPSPEHLKRTHYPFYKTVRNAHPDIPIVMLSKPDCHSTAPNVMKDNAMRRDIVKQTYEKALKEGDKNVYFIDGKDIFREDAVQSSTVDGCHPNDLGFYGFFRELSPIFEKIFG